jgi:hypothetical protein
VRKITVFWKFCKTAMKKVTSLHCVYETIMEFCQESLLICITYFSQLWYYPMLVVFPANGTSKVAQE